MKRENGENCQIRVTIFINIIIIEKDFIKFE